MPGQTEHECHKRRQCHKRRNLRNRFEMVKTLGQGTYGKVKLAIERETGEPFAIKSIKKKQIGTEQDLQRLRREIEIMTHLNHPYIISVHEVFENSDKIILVMEYASGGELYDYCNDKQGLYDDEARKFFRQIISAVHYLHMNGIVHRDLKLENIVLDYNGDCKIADFGFANICREDRLLSTFCGSPLYASPEIVNGLPYHGPEVDCWSLGVLLYAMVYGAMPFDGSDFRRLRNQITAGEYFTPSRPSDAEDLIARLLCPNANRRATIADISNHWWVNLGYKYNPVDDTLPGKPVDQKSLLVRLFSGSPVENDHNKNNNTGDDLMNWTRCSSSQFSRDHTSSPVKEILKFPKQSPQFGCGVSQVLCLQRSRSLDANINLTASWPVSSHKEDEEEKISMHNTNMAFDSHKLPKKSILKKQHSQPSNEHAASKITETLTLDNDLTACVASPCKLNKDICDEHSVDHSVLASDLDDADMAPDAEILTCYDLGDIEAVLDSLVENEVFSDIVVSPSVAANTMAEDSGIVRDISSAETPPTVPQKLDSLSKDDSPVELAESDIVSGLPLSNTRKKGILKNKQNNPTWRYSVGSQDSSSSADILNFSYDSTEGENLFSEYFSMPLTLPMVSDDSLALEMAPMPNQFTEDADEVLGPPPPLPSCPPPSYDGTSSHQENFCFPLKNDEIIEKILQLGNQDTLEPSTEVLSPRMVDWCEVNDIYRKALELHSEWS